MFMKSKNWWISRIWWRKLKIKYINMSKKLISGQNYMKYAVATTTYKMKDAKLTYQYFREGDNYWSCSYWKFEPLRVHHLYRTSENFMKVASTSIPPPLYVRGWKLASSTVAGTFLYLQRRKPWIQVDWVFLVVALLLKLHHTRKPVYISTILWFHRKIAGIVRAKSIPTAFLVLVYLQTIRYNQLLSNNNVLD